MITKLFLGIYDFMARHSKVRWLLLFVSTALLLVLMFRLRYKEDISDFLPLGQRHAEALRIYQRMSAADRIFIIFQSNDTAFCCPDDIVDAIGDYTDILEQEKSNSEFSELTYSSGIDIGMMEEMQVFLYQNIPYFLTEADYERMDSLLSSDDYVVAQLQEDKRQLMLPSAGIVGRNIAYDPLSLFAPVAERMQEGNVAIEYEIYDGYIFSPDMQRSIIMMDSPYGSSETERNARLLSYLQNIADSTLITHPNINIHLIGGPVIAVANSEQIKLDSMLSVTLAVSLILLLLFYVFRDIRNLLLIAVSIAWGWLFALGGLSLVHKEISIIVIGISAVILGIAVNYPLHMIAHLSHDENKRSAFKDIITPLIVGNITTIGAFLALVPLRSVALRDLGLFASFLLLGTICFVLFFLPHIAYKTQRRGVTLIDSIGNMKLDSKPWMVTCLIVLTLLFGYFSFQTRFDANLSNINYMTDEQKQDLAYFQRMLAGIESSAQVYAVSLGKTQDEALRNSENLRLLSARMFSEGDYNSIKGCADLISSPEKQSSRLARWRAFTAKYAHILLRALEEEGDKVGFAKESFAPFCQILGRSYSEQDFEYFRPLTDVMYRGYAAYDSIAREYTVVDVLHTTPDKSERVKELLGESSIFCFDMMGINSAIANHLSDNFNYIGWMCSLIVFLFLWISMGSIELAIISFIPMAISWVWILGAMAMLGIQFNIVNIILATFIFGQGDDYTIFMTEGVCYEYAYRRKILNSYKNSITISALIMFIGIGTLITARHPALHSLAEVTIIGMFSVVLMAYVLPPMLFRFMVSKKGKLRVRPLYLRPVLAMAYSATVFFLQLFSFCVYRLLLSPINAELRMRLLHNYAHRSFRFNFSHMPNVRFRIDGFAPSLLSKPLMLVCNHQSMFDAVIFMALSPKCIVVSNQNPPSNLVIKKVFKWLGFISLSGGLGEAQELMRRRVEEGYSIVVFPEGERNAKSSILRFHKGAFYLAERLGLDILPVVLHGANDVLPRNSIALFKGTITVRALPVIDRDDISWGTGYAERTKRIHAFYVKEYAAMASSIQTASYYKEYILDRYRYKGVEIFNEVKRRLKTGLEKVDSLPCGDSITVADEGYGEIALVAALVAPRRQVNVMLRDNDCEAVFLSSSEGIDNVRIVKEIPDNVSPIRL